MPFFVLLILLASFKTAKSVQYILILGGGSNN